MAFFLFTFALLLIGGVAFGAYVLRNTFAKKRAFNNLNLKLFLIQVPQLTKKDGNDFKKEVNLSEQLFASLASLELPFILEAAVHNVGEAIHFYIGVHRAVADAAIKQVQGIWPESQVMPVADYNVFNSAGASASAYIIQKENFALPVKTYAEIEADTFGPILSGLSKVNEIGEGAAIQLLIAPAPKGAKKGVLAQTG